MSDTVIKKINNTIIFYERGNEKKIEQLFLDGFFDSNKIENIEFINNDLWVKKHYFRKGLMKFLGDNYFYTNVYNTRTYQEYSILNYLSKSNFNTCKPVLGWISLNNITYKANLVVENIKRTKTLSCVLSHLNSKTSNHEKVLSLFYHLGQEVARMHLLGVFHGDLNANNILISEDIFDRFESKSKDVFIIDFDKSKITKLSKKNILSNINRLKRSLSKIGIYDKSNFSNLINGYKSISNDLI